MKPVKVEVNISDEDLSLVTFGGSVSLNTLVGTLLSKHIAFRKGNKTVHDFISEEIECDFMTGEKLEASKLYSHYLGWCEDNNVAEIGKLTFYKCMCGIPNVYRKVSTGNKLFIYNLGLKN